MTLVLPDPLNIPDLVLVPQNEASFLQAVVGAANDRQKQLLVVDINKSVASIRHKLSIAMYQTALICLVNANDLYLFEEYQKKAEKPPAPSSASYKGCVYLMEDIDHYRLLVMFFIETFSATCFSLLDVCGYLLNNVYDLGLTARETSFHKAKQELQHRKAQTDPIMVLLSNYDLSLASPVPWLKPLKEMRNRTTHRPITDVCDAHTSLRRGLHAESTNQSTELYLNENLFSPVDPNKKLCDFIQEAFEGSRDFVEKLYCILLEEVQQQGSLPLS